MKLLLTLALLLVIAGHLPAQNNMQLLQINGTQISVHIMGQGSPIIVVHGGPGLNHSYFLPQLAQLARTHQLIFFDQRACGNSSGALDSSQMTLDWFVKDIESIRQELHLNKVTVLAHSWGGLLGMLYASRYPKSIQSLILTNTVGPKAGEFDQETNRVIISRYSKKDSVLRTQLLTEARSGNLDVYERLFKLSFKHSFFNKRYIDSLNLILPTDFLQKRKALFYMSKELSSYDFYPMLNNITCPTLIIHGSYDAIPLTLPERIQKAIPNSRLEVISDTGHFPFIEKNKEFVRLVEKFLKEN